MSDKDAKYDLMYAYALGCLDDNQVLNFKELTVSDDNFAWDELGEFQNLAALMASILTVEIPKPEVKEKVAQKLYSLKNEGVQPSEQSTDVNKENETFDNIDEFVDEPVIDEPKESSIFETPFIENETVNEEIDLPTFENDLNETQLQEEIDKEKDKEFPDEEIKLGTNFSC